MINQGTDALHACRTERDDIARSCRNTGFGDFRHFQNCRVFAGLQEVRVWFSAADATRRWLVVSESRCRRNQFGNPTCFIPFYCSRRGSPCSRSKCIGILACICHTVRVTVRCHSCFGFVTVEAPVNLDRSSSRFKTCSFFPKIGDKDGVMLLVSDMTRKSACLHAALCRSAAGFGTQSRELAQAAWVGIC